jgi:hypothetical protein
MFNLEMAIAEWRKQMAAGGIKSSETLNELESHLRDEVERQKLAGGLDQQAFEVAAQRIGKSKDLAPEFTKTKEPGETKERKFKLLFVVLAGVLYLLPFALSAPKPWSGLDPAHRWLGLGAIALTVLSMFSGLLLRRFLPVIPDKRLRTKIQFTSVIPVFIWLLAFAFVILPRIELTIGQVTVATLWAISPLAIFGGLTFGLDEAARQTTSTTAS